jgi:hypothetical protein
VLRGVSRQIVALTVPRPSRSDAAVEVPRMLPSGRWNVSVPFASPVMLKPPSCTAVWWRGQMRIPLSTAVRPPVPKGDGPPLPPSAPTCGCQHPGVGWRLGAGGGRRRSHRRLAAGSLWPLVSRRGARSAAAVPRRGRRGQRPGAASNGRLRPDRVGRRSRPGGGPRGRGSSWPPSCRYSGLNSTWAAIRSIC